MGLISPIFSLFKYLYPSDNKSSHSSSSNPFEFVPIKDDSSIYTLVKKMRFVKLRSRLNGDSVLNLSNFDFSPFANNFNFWNFIKEQKIVHFKTLEKVYFRNSILSGLDLSLTNFNSTNPFWLPNDSLLIDNGGLLPAPNLYFDFKNAKLTYTNLTGLNFKRSNFNHAILNNTNIEYCSFTNTRYLQFKEAILENIDIGRGIFIDGQLVLDKKRIEKFFSDQGATSISFSPERPIYSSHTIPVFTSPLSSKLCEPFIQLQFDLDLEKFIAFVNKNDKFKKVPFRFFHVVDNLHDLGFFFKLTNQKYALGENTKLNEFLSFFQSTIDFQGVPNDQEYIKLAKKLNPQNLTLDQLTQEISSSINSPLVKTFIKQLSYQYLMTFFVITDTLPRRLFPD